MRKLKRNKRAITPVLSSLLLTVIAVAGMSIAVTATYVITDGLHDNMGERLIVEDVWFTSGQVSLYVRNVGKIAIEIDAVYVNNNWSGVIDLHHAIGFSYFEVDVGNNCHISLDSWNISNGDMLR